MRRRRKVSPSPPAGFPVYGLDGPWSGPRWLEGFGDVIGEEVRWVRLAHQDPETGALVMVETCSRPLTDAAAARAGVDPLRTVAFDVGALLANLTLPAESVPRPAGIARAIVEHVDQLAVRYADWPTVTWRVDGAAVAARVWRFAGGWAAVSDPIGGVYLGAASTSPPEDLALTAVRDGRRYGFELGQPLDPGARGAAPGGRPPLRRRQDWDADQVALFRDRGLMLAGDLTVAGT